MTIKRENISKSNSLPNDLKLYYIFSYSTSHLENKDKVRFYYALKGRDGISGIIKKYKIDQLGKTVLMVTFKQKNNVTEFLEYWKCKYQIKEVFAK